MNKKVVAAIAAGIVIVGGIYFAMSKKSTDNQISGDSNTNTENTESGGLFSSIKDAMQKGVALKCEYTDEEGQSSIAYIKGDKVKSIISNPSDKSGPNNFLMLNNSMYMWSTSTNQGFVIKVDEQAIEKSKQQTQGLDNADKATNTDIVGTLETYKDRCKPATVADSEFEKPSNVTFQDFSKLFQTPGN